MAQLYLPYYRTKKGEVFFFSHKSLPIVYMLTGKQTVFSKTDGMLCSGLMLELSEEMHMLSELYKTEISETRN